jgi:hypothetical protein
VSEVQHFYSDRFYSAPQVWRLSGAPRQMVYEALECGDLLAFRRGRRWLVPGSSVLEWIGAREPAKETQ